MVKTTNPQHPLVRDGRSQTERLDLGMLAPGAVALDDRSERQLLVYLNEFAKAVVFYGTDDTPEKQLLQSNWQPFFRSSSSVHTSLIEAFDLAGYDIRYQATKQRFIEGLNRADYALWFDFLFDSALTVNNWFLALSNDVVLLESKVVLNETPLRRIIQDVVRSNLQPALAQLFGVANLFVRSTEAAAGYQIPDLAKLAEEPAKDLWDLESIQYNRDTTLSGLEHRPIERTRRIHDRLDDIFRTFAKTIRQIVADAARQDILQATGTHEPHLALLYTFLRLLQPVKQDFNWLTQKHLDFYYYEVLGLKPKPLVPDALHVLFELPKPLPQYRLPQKALLKDGKDANKIDVHFALNEEIILHHTQIAELRTLYRDQYYFLAKPKAHSADGLGKAFAEPAETKWAILGNAEGHDQEAINATIGLAIASEILLLSSGERNVTLTLTCKETIPDKAKDAFEVRLSGSKKWIKPEGGVTTTIENGNAIKVVFTLGIKEDAVVAANPDVLGVDYGLTGEAVVQLLLKKEIGVYEAIRQAQLTQVNIEVNVSELQNVLVRTDEGDQDPTKPFMPFGAIPSVGSVFVIGSPEIFSKNLTELTISFDWDKLPPNDNFSSYYVGYDVEGLPLPSNQNLKAKTIGFKVDGADQIFLFYTNNENKLASEQSFTCSLENPVPNHIQFKLLHDFRHTVYGRLLAIHALALANKQEKPLYKADLDSLKADFETIIKEASDKDSDCEKRVSKIKSSITNNIKSRVESFLSTGPVMINPPYTPVMKNLTVGYTAETSLGSTVDSTGVKLFHILPFDGGANYKAIQLTDTVVFNFEEKKAKPALIGASHEEPKVAESGTSKEEQEPAESGALLIGLAKAVEGSLNPILFQLLESSAKTNLPEATIRWEYLDGNDWLDLRAGEYLVDDATKDFIQSGIVQVVLPERKSTQTTTILPPQFYWLKASTGGNTDAVCKAIGVHTQAALATFAPVLTEDPARRNDPARLALPLAAGSVTKLAVANANIKEIKQPYPSFGGRPSESNTHFYRRVSEQLRHKGRGLTLFDYEHLILEAFPEIFKVKCIPHTYANRSIGEAAATINDVHTAPGYVTVVVVPDATRTQLDDLEKPMASRGLLTRIEDWMKARISPFVKLRVLNPIYEMVDTALSVRFHPGKSPAFYAEQLKKDIGMFLAPWAFDPKAQVNFGGVVYRSAILGFIENRDYVDFVTDFVMKLDKIPQQELRAAAERVIFTNGTHKITLLEDYTLAPTAARRGIGFDWRLNPEFSK